MNLKDSTFWRTAQVVVAFCLLIVGIVTLPTPLPTGLPLLIASFIWLLWVSPWTRERFRRFRAKNRRINRYLRKIADKSPKLLRQPLYETDPDLGP